MTDFKLRYAINGLLLFIIGQFIGMNVPRMMSATGQEVDVSRPIQSAGSVIASPVDQQLAAAQAAVLFCMSGDIPQPICFTATDLAQLSRTTLTISDSLSPTEMLREPDGKAKRDSTHIVYEGVLLREILQRAGVPQGEQLRGSNLARYLVVEGADGYAVVFSLPELDPAFGNRVVLLADRQDGHALEADEMPLCLVIPGDQRRARWVRKITRMRVMPATGTPSKSSCSGW